MRSALLDILPARVRRSPVKLGHDLAVAQRKRQLSIGLMAERTGLAKSTYGRVKKGDPKVAQGAYAMTLFVLGLGAPLGDLADTRRDADDWLLDEARLPKRVRVKKSPAL